MGRPRGRDLSEAGEEGRGPGHVAAIYVPRAGIATALVAGRVGTLGRDAVRRYIAAIVNPHSCCSRSHLRHHRQRSHRSLLADLRTWATCGRAHGVRGDSIETFDAVILGSWTGTQRRQDHPARYVGARDRHRRRAGHERLARLRGRQAGRRALERLAFSKEPIFGITPIGEMLDALDRPDAPPGDAAGGPSGFRQALQ